MFYCIAHPRANGGVIRYFKQACDNRNIQFVTINATTFDYTSASALSDGDMLYRACISSWEHRVAREVERFLIHEKVATLYSSFDRALSFVLGSYIVHQKRGLPIPKTIPHLTRDKVLLKKYVDWLGGFPVIIKATGGSHGVGVIKIDSMESLISVVDYLIKKHDHIIMREYIDVRNSARLIVLNDKVISSITYTTPEGDFRSNVGVSPSVSKREFSQDINNIAIQAVNSIGLKFGGVDILIDKQEKPYITEVNFPCNFARAQDATGIDIAGMMVDYLATKSKTLLR